MRPLAGITALRRFGRDEDGGAMVEFAIVVSVFFLMFFKILDFGIFSSTNLNAEKMTQLAARMATVRPAACSGVPERIARGTATPPPRFGTSCRAVAGACATVATVTCTADATDATAAEIWARISPALPGTVTISDLSFTYAHDATLGYLGGPYTPIVTAELTLPAFSFAAPIGAMATQISGGASGFTGTPQYRTISISIPAEDLALGTNG
ncbi:TadE-like protein [Roseivivax lentus]|uniref:TadE-like protein n=1 Tax=Roseivivax lentus TaxID=633194 RepID=A0A1N7M8Z5_9RHOB|nr:TadE/TadG family type IV pilus assembly protein [Roseivivax lentus]SIS82560.1 TadE-like protein [Roseivivax lentus]